MAKHWYRIDVAVELSVNSSCSRVHPSTGKSGIKRLPWQVVFTVICVGVMTCALQLPRVHAAPAPEVEYVYDVMVRRHYDFPSNDAIGYGHGISDKVGRGETYAQLMADAKSDVTPNDEFAANYLVSYAVNLLCPDQIWQLRSSAMRYRPPD